MAPLDAAGVASPVLHVSTGSAHGTPLGGWSAYSISKAAFFQSFKVLEREFRDRGGKVVVASFKPGIVDAPMQNVVRDASMEAMPIVGAFRAMQQTSISQREQSTKMSRAKPPPQGDALDSVDNVARFAEYLLLGTTDKEFGDEDDPDEYDNRDKDVFPRWIEPLYLERAKGNRE
jgi:NAD(P)-dependent dehydrogenase (short-subunit alcohol dehydrogenase family)